ncbi:MAG: hypothetical protein IPK63_11820 [Candidatus Competibacteraceae bacterium]|nr:hypothetical protein [Candidatus Competibacteraceae bacterium]
MKVRLHRKQALLLGIAGILAVASYWIPTPHHFSSSLDTAKPSPPSNTSTTEPITLLREPAIVKRFSITQPSDATAGSTDESLLSVSPGQMKPLLSQPPPGTPFFDLRVLGNSDPIWLNNVFVLPIKSFELSGSYPLVE